MSSSAGRSQLGWSLPAADWERFVDYVVEKWGAKDPHVRFELEAAMIEFIDRDSDLAQAESLLRDAVGSHGLSSSIAEPLTRDVSPDNKRQVGYRVRTPLKEEFKAFVDTELNDAENCRYTAVADLHISYGEALTAAITEYRDGGRGQRIRELVEVTLTDSPAKKSKDERLETTANGKSSDGSESLPEGEKPSSIASENSTTAGDEWSHSAEPKSAEAEIHSRVVLSISEALPDEFPKTVLRETVVQQLYDEGIAISESLIDRYCEAVLQQLPVVEHPLQEELYIPAERREEMTVWSELDKERRTVLLRQFIVANALTADTRTYSVGYQEVIQLFEAELGAGPSHQYAYDLMEAAAEGTDGFIYATTRGKNRLRVDVRNVDTKFLQTTVESRRDLSKDDLPEPIQETMLPESESVPSIRADGGNSGDD